MSQQFARMPTDAGAVVREVRGFGGVPWRRLLSYLRPHWRPFAIALVGLLLGAGMGLAFPLIIAGITTEVVSGGDPADLDRLIGILIVVFLVQSVGSFVSTYLLGVVGERVVAQLRGELFARLITLSLDFHSAHRVGELVSRLSSDVTLVRTMLTQTITSLMTSLIGLVGSVVILFTLSPTLLVVVLLLAPALIAVAIVFGRPLQRVSTQVQDTIAGSTTTAEEALSGIRVVKSYVREEWELERYDADLRTVVTTGSRLALWRAGFGALMGFLGFGAVAALLWYTGHQVIDGTLGIGTLTGFLLYGVAIGASLGSIAGLYGQFREGTGAIERVFEIIDTRPTVLDAPDARPLERIAGRIELEDVSFAYRPDRVVLREVSLTIPAGETLALVGPSGSGKTTLVGLIPRLWDVTGGTIRVDGADIRDVTVTSLRGQIGLVAQEATLFGGTIAENVRYGRLDATDEELIAAAKAANAHDFITALPEGYDTVVGDRGSRLSGGQRQRVAIARAILKDPPILLLDEATSSLDNESERLVQEALDRLKVGRTTIIVAHRLSTIRAADRIAVLDDGWLVELGSQDELLARDGLYARLHRTQFSEPIPIEDDEVLEPA
ncbi:MAG TPA: ABC transporter ATP-binding protein [Candidatus Saccharimonadales bacterium]|nr:ABC transporter ATP-binding protein [Candidatus Saccharimonadales bacterium]